MKIKATFKKGRLTYPVMLTNVRVGVLNGKREYFDWAQGTWIPGKFIKNPILLEGRTWNG